MAVKQANILAFVEEDHVVVEAWKVRDWSWAFIQLRLIIADDEAEGIEKEPSM